MLLVDNESANRRRDLSDPFLEGVPNSSSSQNSITKNENMKSILSKLITCIGNFSVQYNFQAISAALLMMSTSVCTSTAEKCRDGEQDAWVSGTASAVIFLGALLGQVTMGYAGDVLGRSKAMFLTLSFATLGAVTSAALSLGNPDSIYAIIIVCRLLLGFGVGGLYPLSATKAAEDSSKGGGKVNSYESAKSFFWQAPGAVGPWLVAYLLTYSTFSTNTKWRMVLGLGAVPLSFVLICTHIELKGASQQENPLDDKTFLTDPRNSAKDRIQSVIFERSNLLKLIATGGCWFIYDIAYYGVELFGGEIIADISGDDDNVSADESIQNVSSKMMIANGLGVPAVLLSILLLRPLGIKKLQIVGFLLISLSFLLMACFYDMLKDRNPDLLFALYCLLLFCLSFGPNVTTYILSAEMYPAEIRSTMNGLSAAMGKLGAVFGAYMFDLLADLTSYTTVMVVCALLSIVGAFISHWFIVGLEGEKKYENLSVNDEIDSEIIIE